MRFTPLFFTKCRNDNNLVTIWQRLFKENDIGFQHIPWMFLPILCLSERRERTHETSHLRRPAAGHTEPSLSYQHLRRGAHSAPFLRSGHTGGLPLGGAAFPRLPQRPYHGCAVLRGHGAGPAHTRRVAVYRILH